MSPEPITKSVFEQFQARLDERHDYIKNEVQELKVAVTEVSKKLDKTLDNQRKFLMKIAAAALLAGGGSGFLSSLF